MASQIINRLDEIFHVRLTIESVFNSPTISGLVRKIEAEVPAKPDNDDIQSLDQNSRLPVSLDQKRLWILNQIDPKNPSYNIPFTYRLKGKLNVDIFEKSLAILFDRHSILRSSVKSDKGEPYCIIRNLKKIPVEKLDYSSLKEDEADRRIQDFFTLESRNIFDIEQGPLFRLFLVKLMDDEYIFHMTVQHIVFDGWSWGIFAGELRQIYNDLLNGRKPGLAPLQNQYYDIANWQINHLSDDIFKDSIEYWKTQLKGHPSEINFPFDRLRNKSLSGYGGREQLKLDDDLSDKIRTLSRGENSTTFMIMLAAFGLLLNKYSGDDDICIGVPTANRENSKFEKLIGLFVNTLIIRLRINESTNFIDLLRAVRHTTLEALAHNDLPFEKLIEVLQPERKININPITQILFAYQNTPRPPLDLEGITPERVLIKDTVSPLDITFYAWENAGTIEGEIEFNSDLLDHETIFRMKENFIFLLKSIIEDPEKKLSEISLISENEKMKLDGFNNTEVPVPQCMIQDFFERQAVMVPDKTAIISGSKKLTYRELDEQSNKLSNHLIHLGVIPGDIVGIYLERSSWMVISILGILKAGCCYLPLDTSFPPDRLRFIVSDAGIKAIITGKSLKDNLRHFTDSLSVIIDDKKNKTENYSAEKPDLQPDPQLLAYILYTSGSTGKPKGVKVHHQAVVNLINSMSKTPGINKNDTLLAVVTLTFDMSVFELFLPLSNGATIVVANGQDLRNGQTLISLIDKYKITILQAAPSLFFLLLASGWKGKKDLKALCGGEALTSGLVNLILPKVGELWNCYGPTETTVFSTLTRIADSDSKILIGRPVDNTRIYILDKDDNMLPAGVMGEIGIGGMGVSKGYLNQPSLTSEKFIQLNDGDLVYKTGDRGRYLKDGNVELFGRIDNQIKIRGIRIEPGEIELLISKIEGINEAVVKLQKFGENDDRLVAFLNVSDNFSNNIRNINDHIKKELPAFMVPAAYKILKEFPRTSSGKIDRKAIFLDPGELVSKGKVDLPDLTPSEKIIREIWCSTLKTHDISVGDNFFEVGGNSLLAISVFSKIESEFNISLGLRVFFDSPRIKDLGEIIDIAKQNMSDNMPGKREKDFSKIVKGHL